MDLKSFPAKAKPTYNAIQMLVNGTEESLKNYTPTVQVLDVKKVLDGDESFYRLTISDALHSFTAVKLASDLKSLVETGQLDKWSTIRLNNYTCNKIDGQRVVIIIQKLDVTSSGQMIGAKIGNPRQYLLPSLLTSFPRPQITITATSTTSTIPKVTVTAKCNMKTGNVQIHRFDGSGENEPGLERVKSDISRLQKALKAIRDRQTLHPDMDNFIHKLISEYELAKAMNCSNYKEIANKLGEIVNIFHVILETYFHNDCLWWPAYAKAVTEVRILLIKAQDMGYTGLKEAVEYPTPEDLGKHPLTFELNGAAVRLLSSADTDSAKDTNTCVICSKTCGCATLDQLQQNSVVDIYPCAQPTLVRILPEYNIQLQTVCSLDCDKKRSTREITMLRNYGIRFRQRDLEWNLCQLCYKEDILRKCAGCSMAYYCSQQCQQSDWPTHKATCKKLRILNMNFQQGIKPESRTPPEDSTGSTPSNQSDVID